MALSVGDVIGDYQVIGILGAGGMGQVYKVRNTISDRVEALKILLPNLESDPELIDRFLREIKVQASLDHPNIASLHTAQRAGNQLLMFMEFVEGESLESILHRGPIPVTQGVDCISQVAAALAYAHARGVVHRDIKPANIMLMPDGGVKLMDFGIAKAVADRRLTQTGKTVGSLYYMSPEQINGVGLDGRSDLYSLGVALYEVATGRRPFQGDSDYSIMAAHLQAAPIPPIQIDPRLPEPLNEIILVAIAKDPAQRFQSAEAFHVALETVKSHLGCAPAPIPAAWAPPPPPEPARQGSSRRLLYMIAGSLATVAVLVVAATQIPKWRAARAGGEQQAPVQIQEQAPPPPATTTAPAAPAGTQPEAAAPAPARSESRPPVRSTQQASPPPVQQTPPPQQAAPPQQPAQQPPPGPDLARQAELRQLRERMMLQGTRLTPAKAGVDNLRRVQAQSGLGMRQDVLTALQRAEYYMDESESALRSGDPAAARKALDSAEREIERLEKFLGR